MDVDAAALELYGLPPEEFTAARNVAAQQAKDAGDTRSISALKALRKPTLAAWLANTLVRAEPDGIDELTELGEQLRDAHRSGDGRRLRELTLTRHGLVHKLVTTARAQARAHGHTVSTATEQRLSETLAAAIIDLAAARLLRAGQLTSALRHVGFGVVDETGEPAQLPPLTPRVVRSSRPTPQAPATKTTKTTKTAKTAKSTARRTAPADLDVARTRRAELRGRAQQAERVYAAAENERIQAEADFEAHEHHLADLEATIEQLTEQLDQIRKQLRDNHRRTRALQVEVKRTTRNANVAQQRRDASQQRLEALDR